ncbi:MAG: ribosome maturation factor RimM [Tissierellia bacterium]|nr:ribosome maturation factor RimM [Tissierellia bacterium]
MDWIKVGQIVNTYGIKGELKLFPLTFDPDRFNQGGKYRIEGMEESISITHARPLKNLVVIRLEGYDDINQVIPFKGKYLYVSEGSLLPLPEDTYYIHDLVGLEVYEGERQLGRLAEVIEGSANDIYRIENLDNKSFLVPAVREFIKEVDLESGILRVELIEGMSDAF